MKVSQILGKRLCNGAGREGYILSVTERNGNLSLKCADSNEREFAVSLKELKRDGGKLKFDKTERKTRGNSLRLGRAGFDENGTYIGILEDFTVSGGILKSAKIGKKNYPADGLILGDVIIVKSVRRLKSDVTKGGETLFKKGTYVTEEILSEAAAAGEYVQTTLKSI